MAGSMEVTAGSRLRPESHLVSHEQTYQCNYNLEIYIYTRTTKQAVVKEAAFVNA